MTNITYQGGCLCGDIRFNARGKPANAHACSCANCQQHSGAPVVCWVEFAAEDVAWTGRGGAPSRYRSSAYSSRAFCPRCGSTLGAMDDAPVIALVTGSFDARDDAALQPASHSYKDVCPGWMPSLFKES